VFFAPKHLAARFLWYRSGCPAITMLERHPAALLQRRAIYRSALLHSQRGRYLPWAAMSWEAVVGLSG
jgi:hypothetical protein